MSTETSVLWRRITVRDLDIWLALLHAAYASNLDDGMNFTAATLTRQQGETTIENRWVWGRFTDEELVATFTLRQDEEGWHVNFLAVHPQCGRSGLGSLSLSEAEQQARRLGATVLLLDTAEIHPWLPAYYQRRGYVAYDYKQWPGKTYRSVCFRKSLS